MFKSVELQKLINGMPYIYAIDVITRLCNGVREPMGDEHIARFQVNGPDYSAIMFFNHEGMASNPSFNFND